MQVEFLIVGQGISGTWLSYYLQKENKSFLIIDNNQPNAPSRLAAGIINPVTGRRHVEVWMADGIMPFAWNAYTELGNELGITVISQKNIIDFFPSPQMRSSFQQRVEENAKYISLAESLGDLRTHFNYDFGYGEIKPVYTAHLETILPAWRNLLQQNNYLLEEDFDLSQLKITVGKIEYKNITAQKIIFCDGNSSAGNPYFRNLPFAPNKGEALTLEIPELPDTNIYKKGLSLVPLAAPGQWWIGSNYAWEFDNENPTVEFREKTEELLKSWLRIPFTVTGHLCGIRPATLERRPFIGIHPQHPKIGILNGMGTKGCSLAPFFAKQLADYLLYNKPINPEADISRFTRILTR
jgi:glycine/D-amino acid oxidase-like deaminating enzyme